jgi:diguanylate cyclase (GGDEF)-like protein
MNWTRPLRGYFARREDPYAGGDLANAKRIGTVIWGLLTALAAALLALNPPNHGLGDAGWIFAVALIAGFGVMTWQLRKGDLGSWGTLLLASYLTVAGLGVLQWLCGGQVAPYRSLLLLPVVFVAATQPPRRIAAFMGFVLLSAALPFVYDSWDATRAEGVAVTFVIWSALAAGGNLLMSGIRAQRIAHVADEAEARHEARIDSLTGLHNRRAYDELLIAEVARARRLRLPLSVAMVDIQNFKEINDRWSYAEGDRCLREVATTLRDNVRQPDFCFRWGGDEFALILSGTPADDTGPIAERLQAEVTGKCKRPDESPIRIRFAVSELRDGVSPPELTEMAGLALTSAKLDAAR